MTDYAIMVVADVLVPNGHQAISNHHADLTMTPIQNEVTGDIEFIITY